MAQSNFWNRTMRVNISRPWGCPCLRPLLRAPAYLQCVGGLKSHDLRASTCLSRGSSESWLRHSCFEAYRKIAQELLMRHLFVVLGLALHVNRCSLASPTGPFSFHGSFCLVKMNGRATRRVAQSIRHTSVTLLHDLTRIRHMASTLLVL